MAAPYANCTDAELAGHINIPATDPGYGTHLDSDLDGIGCEVNVPGNGETNPTPVVANPPAQENVTAPEVVPNPVQQVEAGAEYSQVSGVPVGGADTGVAVEENSNMGGLVTVGGLSVVAAAGAVVAARHRSARA